MPTGCGYLVGAGHDREVESEQARSDTPKAALADLRCPLWRASTATTSTRKSSYRTPAGNAQKGALAARR